MQDTELFADDELLFTGEEVEERPVKKAKPWRVLVVDDEPDIHTMTQMVLGDYSFEGRKLEFISAFTGEESLNILKKDHEIAVVLLDVVMETSTAGLDVARRIRTFVNNQFVRIILRTGQPGVAPEHKVITELDINDYWQKAELTSQRLTTSITTALRSYRDLRKIEQNRVSLAQLAMSVAHQIRNRTMTITGFANLATRKLDQESDIAKYLETISEESGRLEEVVGSVSDYASIDNCDHQNSEIFPLLEEVIIEIKKFAANLDKNVEFDISLKHAVIDGRPDLFKKAIEELMKNAVIFSDESSPRVELSVQVDSELCQIKVIDNGSGIDDADLPYIYDPFFTKRPEAVGMGLSIVRRVIEGYNWTLDYSKEGRNGAVFTLIIPI
ncbi:Signal transduction histidine kinase [Maridesulfovibrio ferrireducens]|uniref:histidine kinase n=1 Tax=Maridesulfovibrio ferrireducens TaxID=246191 RepID=A0A1G9H5J7_9BACT|nr:HAMP domain-containing sensor histidine kinase [Maridesulfovibrio ferrireducens]SDL08201.1 Signal transduction histidine kinase [Maridesulfovibrio ferrireducens]